MKSRRQFLGEASCAAIGSVPVLSTLLNLTLANHAAAQSLTPGSRKTLVCVFLSGGCDTFNFLIPRDQPGGYDDYAAARSNLAIPRNSLLPLNFTDAQGRTYGIHPSCPRIAEMFNGMGGNTNQKRLSLIANIGTLVERLPNKSAFEDGSVVLPKALFSHRDQIEQWQTSVPQGQQVLTGWAGRAADFIHTSHNTEQTAGFYMPMNFSLAGNSTFQIGSSEGQFVITSRGALAFTGSDSSAPTLQAKDQLIRDTVASPIEDHYRNLFQRTHARMTANSIERGVEFGTHFNNPGSLNNIDVNSAINAASFPNHPFANNLKAAIRTIAIRPSLKLARQTIFLDFGGWDHHSELLNTQAGMLAVLDQSLHAFQSTLEILGLANDVVTFTASDFGRTLRSNGQGTDHAWSGNQLVMGGPITGGQVAGTFPSLAIDGPDDVGRGGRIYPKVSCDEFFCEMLRWFGVSPTNMEGVLPNIRNFHDPASPTGPLGIIS